MDDEESCEWCEHCLYIGDGDFFCDELQRIIASDWAISICRPCDGRVARRLPADGRSGAVSGARSGM